MKKNYGLTFIEMMLALSLSVILSGSFYKIYLTLDQNYNLMQSLAEIQHTVRALSMMLTQDIHNRGVMACQSYVINKTNRHNLDGTPIYGLYELKPNAHPVELAENISQLNKAYDFDHENKITGVSISYSIRGIENSPLLKKREFIYVAINNKEQAGHGVIDGVSADANYVDREPLSTQHGDPRAE